MNYVDVASELSFRRKARNSFRDFVLYMNKNYIVNEMFDEISARIDELIENIEKNTLLIDTGQSFKAPRIILEAPPRSGKTMLISHYFPCYYIGRFPQNKILSCSFGEELLRENARWVKRILLSKKYENVFGNPFDGLVTQVNAQDTVLHFDVFRGRYDGYTVGGSIIGRGANLLIVDDPIKNSEMAFSKKQKENLETWFYNDACTRLEQSYSIVLMHQRWAVDDLAGRVIEKEPDRWIRKSFPAIKEDGTSISPILLPIEELLHKQQTMPNFNAMYQQNPVKRGGNIIRSEYFNTYTQLPPKIKKSYFVVDTAMKIGQKCDYTVISYWIKSYDDCYYLVDLVRKQMESPEMLERLVSMFNKYRPTCVYIEDKASGTSLIQMLRKRRVPIMELKPVKDKVLRVYDVLPKIVSGFVFLQDKASYIHDFIMECDQFSEDMSHPYDDQVDCLSYALSDQCDDSSKKLNIKNITGLNF